MTDVIDRLVVAMNAHDLDAVAGFIHEDYRSEQPAHPGRAFAGRAQMLANWEAMLAGIPDFHAEICRSVQDGDDLDRMADFGAEVRDPREHGLPVGEHLGSSGEGPAGCAGCLLR